MPRLYKRGSSYYFKKQIDGRRVQVCTGENTIAAAREFLAKWEAQHCGQVSTSIAQLIEAYRHSSKHLTRHTVASNISSLRAVLRTLSLPESAPCWRLTREAALQFQESRTQQGYSPSGVNSTMRQSKCVLRTRSELPLPDFAGFLGVPRLRSIQRQWTPPNESVISQTQGALSTLAREDPQAYSAFVLAFCLGLRKSEVLNFDQSWIKDGYVVIGDSSFVPKSGRARVVPIPPGLELDGLPKVSEKAVRRLNKWLRAQGWNGRMAIHELRKYYGSQVTRQCGLFVAQRLLGHSEPSTTAASYAALLDLPTLDLLPGHPAKKSQSNAG